MVIYFKGPLGLMAFDVWFALAGSPPAQPPVARTCKRPFTVLWRMGPSLIGQYGV